MITKTYKTLLLVCGLALCNSACTPSVTSLNEDVPKAVSAEEAMKTELGVANAAFAALKANDHRAFAALLRPDAGTGLMLVESIEPFRNGQTEFPITEDDRVDFEKDFGFRPEDYDASRFRHFVEVMTKNMFSEFDDFAKRIKALGPMKMGRFSEKRGQRYVSMLPNGAQVEIDVLHTENGEYCIGTFDIDDWNGPQEEEEAVASETEPSEHD